MAQEMAHQRRSAGAQVHRAAEHHDSGEATRSRIVFRALTDIYETGDSIFVMAELPGVAPEDVDVTLDRNQLSIRGRALAPTHKGYEQVYGEYADGDYERVFTLSEEVDRERIKATHKNGVLVLELPKAAMAKTKRIEVKSR